MDKVLALDIGGTSVKCGMVSEKGELLCREQCEVQGGPLLSVVKDAVNVQLKNAQTMGVQLCGIAAAVTGQIDTVNGVVAGTNGAIPGWEGVHLVKELQLESGLGRVIVENDANCAAYIEAVKGAGAEKRNVLLVTLGTGIGGGISAEGKALCDRLMLRLEDMVMPRFLEGLSVCTARYRNEAGMLGAAKLFFDKKWE